MAEVALFVIAGQSNAGVAGIDNRLYEVASAQGSDFTIIKTSLGGTSLYPKANPDWDPSSGELFDVLVANVKTTMNQIRAAGDEPVVYTLWIQGEGDRNRLDYAEKLTDFIGSYRAAIGQSESTFTVSLLNFVSPARDAQIRVAADVAHVNVIDPFGGATWDDAHFERATRVFLGEAFFAATGATIGSSAAYDNQLAVAGFREDPNGFNVIGPRYTDYVWNNTSARVRIRTANGDDVIKSGDFDDDIATGGNDDRVSAGGGNDLVDLGMHNDFARAGAGNDTVIGGFGDDRIFGDDGHDTLFGNEQNDRISGGNGFDRLEGGGGDDRLFGDAGRDKLLGGSGADRLAGGADADSFVFAAADYGSDTPARPDVIVDFSAAEGDLINLYLIDANVTSARNDRFTFIGEDPFHKVAGELRVVVKPTYLSLLGDTNGDGVADVIITVLNARAIPPENIIL